MNILFIMTDHANGLSVAPGSPCRVPHLDRLAATGFRFGRCYTTNAICSPARASLMTGQYASTHGVWDCTHTQRPEWVDVCADRHPFFSMPLAQAGYACAYFGKWHVEQSKRLERFGWDEYDLQPNACKGTLLPGSEIIVPKEGYRDYRPAGIASDASTPSHPAFDRAAAFIRSHHSRCPDRPFCCFISTSEPHDPYHPPERFFRLYDEEHIPLPDSLHDPLDDKPEAVRRLRETWDALDDRQWRRIRACYWATLSFIDAEIGRLLDVLAETGHAQDTLVVFTSDHGDMQGAHGLAAKGFATAYEEVYNIPLVLRIPGLAGGVEDSRHVVSMVDLAPTLLDYCGLPPLPGAQGRSLRPVLEGRADEADWRDAYAEFYGQRFLYTQRIVWHGPWKYIFSPGGRDELYNLAEDPGERSNVAADPALRPVLLDMCRRMWRKAESIGDTSLSNSHYVTLRTAPVGPLA